MSIAIKTNYAEFKKQIAELALSLSAKPSNVIREFVPLLVEDLVNNSPVGDPNYPQYKTNKNPENQEPGWYISNWQVTFNQPTGTLPNEGIDGQSSVDRAIEKMRVYKVKRDPSIYVSNMVPYALTVENVYGYQVADQAIKNIPFLVDEAIIRVATR